MTERVAFIGAGSWGMATAALVAQKNEHDVVLWARRPELAETINVWHENPEYLADLPLPESLRASNDMEETVEGAVVVVMGVPSHGFRMVLREVVKYTPEGTRFVSLTKGIEVDTRKRMSEVIREEVPGISDDCVAVLSGPNLAKEIMKGFPAASTIANADIPTAEEIQQIFHAPTFRCYTNDDVVGCELGGAFKNVIAIAAGVADGLGFGDNTKATVITRGLAELARFSVKFGGKPLTFLGLAGVGDLMATCASPQSRNHSVGIELGKGRKIDEIVASMNMVAEGVKSCQPILALGREADVYMPITEAVVGLCHEDKTVEDTVQELLARDVRGEFEGVGTWTPSPHPN
jgi:glycerol-3-phosphate dehydrogenase (NAD(P)+)